MRYCEYGARVEMQPNGGLYKSVSLRIHVGRSLVQYEDLVVVDYRSGQADQLTFSHAEVRPAFLNFLV